MENGVIDTAALAGSVAAHDLSMIGLFLRADLVVKTVMVLLILASVWSWAIIFEKILRVRRLNGHASAMENEFWSGGSLDKLYDGIGQHPRDPMQAVFVTGMREWRRAQGRKPLGGGLGAGLAERIDRIMNITVAREMEQIERRMTFLASTGATAPFLGLFGTVWGIMNSFSAIALTKNTSLAVVAPGIAEALFATALGLVAAIPAVLGYNKISRDLDRYAGRLEGFAGEFSAILSRRLEDGSAAGSSPAGSSAGGSAAAEERV